ncbi:WD40 repeat domain-containing protein [Motiliproteus sp.]|uniref:WD40 repeat domain-containing protein n=1 Tax=Motiliproteus sp. TaxID=1898955 RepID=UPI003BACDE13
MTLSKSTGRLSFGLALALVLAGCSQGDKPSDQAEYAVQGLYSADISEDSRFGIVGSIQHGGSLWKLQDDERLFNWNHAEGAYSNLVAADFSPEGDYAITAGQQDMVLWQVSDGQPVWFWNAPSGILDAALAPDGNFALLGLDNHTAVYFDIKNGGLRHTLTHQGRVRAVDVSQDGDWALTGADDNIARFWDLQSGDLVHQVQHENGVNTVALSPSGAFAFSAGQLEKALIWRTGSGELHQTLTTDESFVAQRISYTAARFSPNSDQLLTGTSSGLVQLWDVSEGAELRRWELFKRDPFRPTSATVYGLGFGNGVYYAIASNGFVNVLR